MGWFSTLPKGSKLVEVNLRYKPGSLHQNLYSSPYIIMLLKLWRVQKEEGRDDLRSQFPGRLGTKKTFFL